VVTTSRSRRLLAAAVAVPLLLAGCGDDGETEAATTTTTSDGEASTTTTTHVASTTTTLSAEGEVLAAYAAANEAFVAAADPPNPDHPDLLATRTGASLERTQSNLRQLAGQGVGGRLSYESYPGEVTIAGDEATFTDCFVDHTQLYELASGATSGDPGRTVIHLDVVMRRSGEQWVLADTTTRTDPCEPG
jgi:hypothetical protein